MKDNDQSVRQAPLDVLSALRVETLPTILTGTY